MSVIAIRAALETAIAGISPSLATAWENVDFTPPGSDEPYQEVFVRFAEPDNREIGRQYVQRGFAQVTLKYPKGAGSAAAAARAELLKSTLYRGLSLTSGGVTVTVEKTPEVAAGPADDERFVLIVRVRFYAPVNV